MAINYTFTTFSQFASASYPDLAELPNKFWLVGYDAENYRELRFDIATTLNPIITCVLSSYTTITTLSSELEDSFDNVVADLEASFKKLSAETVSKEMTYTNPNPMPSDFKPADGIVRFAKGTTFDNVLITDIITQLLYPTINATLSLSNTPTLIKAGATTSRTINVELSEGSTITHGANRTYNFTGTGWDQPSITNTSETVSNELTMSPTSETKLVFTVSVTQNNVEKATKSFVVESVYPLYATTINSTTYTEQSLTSKNIQTTLTLAGESANTYYTFDIPDGWNAITKIEVWNPVTNKFEEWSKWRTEFNQTSITHDGVAYKRYARTGKPQGEVIGSNTFKLTF